MIGPLRFGSYRVLQWVAFLIVAVLLCAFLAVADPGALILFVPIFLLLAGFLAWTQSRMQSQLDYHGGSIPMPGMLGLLGANLTDGAPSGPEPTAVPEAPPTCPKCGAPSRLGDLTCARCGASLWPATSST
jgi:hypothetical protein